MQKQNIIIIVLLFLSIIFYIVYTKFYASNVSYEYALKIGEEKYLKFLWMVDGAFNDERLNEEFIVNGKKLDDKDKLFTCKYENNKECIGNNFDSEFKKLFSSSINYKNVYSDFKIYSWLKYSNGKYIFNNLNICNINRMGQNHELKVMKIDHHKIKYEVMFNNRQTDKIIKRNFILNLEDNEWKIVNAYYHDLCGINYTIY